eukprot:1839737-Pleurochrysis_carterae.AAC.3
MGKMSGRSSSAHRAELLSSSEARPSPSPGLSGAGAEGGAAGGAEGGKKTWAPSPKSALREGSRRMGWSALLSAAERLAASASEPGRAARRLPTTASTLGVRTSVAVAGGGGDGDGGDGASSTTAAMTEAFTVGADTSGLLKPRVTVTRVAACIERPCAGTNWLKVSADGARLRADARRSRGASRRPPTASTETLHGCAQ